MHHLQLTVTQTVQLERRVIQFGVALALQFDFLRHLRLDGLECFSSSELALLAAILTVLRLGVGLALLSEGLGVRRAVRGRG